MRGSASGSKPGPMESSLPHTAPARGSAWPASTRARMKPGQQQDVRIQGQHPLGAAGSDGLVLGFRETQVAVVSR